MKIHPEILKIIQADENSPIGYCFGCKEKLASIQEITNGIAPFLYCDNNKCQTKFDADGINFSSGIDRFVFKIHLNNIKFTIIFDYITNNILIYQFNSIETQYDINLPISEMPPPNDPKFINKLKMLLVFK